MRTLQAEADIVQRQKKIDESAFISSCNLYGGRSCTALCQLMYSKLPTELREAIYAYLIGPPEVQQVNGPENRRRLKTFCCDIYRPSYFERPLRDTRVGDGEYPHWLYLTYTGQHVDREIAAYWYRTRIFRFERPTDRQWIQKFRHIDIFGKGLLPGDLIQHVEFAVSKTDVHSAASQRKLQRDLETLEGIGNKNVFLQFKIPKDQEERISCMIPTVRRLRNKGFTRVEVWHRGNALLGERGTDCTDLFAGYMVAKIGTRVIPEPNISTLE